MMSITTSGPQSCVTRRKLLAGVMFFILGLIIFSFYSRETEEMGDISKKLALKLQQEHVSFFKVTDAADEQIVEQLNRLFKQSHQLKEIHVEIWKGASPPKGFHRRLTPPGESSSSVPKTGVTFLVKDDLDVDLGQLLNYMSKLSEARFGQKGNTLYFINGDGKLGPMVENTFRVTPDFFNSRKGALAKSPEQFFSALGIPFYEGSQAEFISPERLRIRCFEEEMDQFYPYGDCEPTWIELFKWRCEARWEKVKAFMGYP